jgi:hypothetical protein
VNRSGSPTRSTQFRRVMMLSARRVTTTNVAVKAQLAHSDEKSTTR